MSKYFLKFTTLGMTFTGGEFSTTETYETIKEKATNILISRHIKKLDGASITNEAGEEYAHLYMPAYNLPKRVYEWLRVYTQTPLGKLSK